MKFSNSSDGRPNRIITRTGHFGGFTDEDYKAAEGIMTKEWPREGPDESLIIGARTVPIDACSRSHTTCSGARSTGRKRDHTEDPLLGGQKQVRRDVEVLGQFQATGLTNRPRTVDERGDRLHRKTRCGGNFGRAGTTGFEQVRHHFAGSHIRSGKVRLLVLRNQGSQQVKQVGLGPRELGLPHKAIDLP